MIPLMKNTFLQEDATKRALADFILNSHRLSMGEQCIKFENQFAQWQGAKHGLLFNSGGSANLAMLQALKNLGKLKDGDKIGFSALTWSTNTMPIIQLGMEPIAIDCSTETLNVMSTHLLETLSKVDLKAFFVTNVLGFTGDMPKIKSICQERGIILIEDNCESLGSKTAGVKAGGYGLASSCSFYVAHHMSTIEGGIVTTDDDEMAEMLKIVRANGWDRNLEPEQQEKWRKKFGVENDFYAKYTFFDLGYNLRPTEITGFLGSYQMQFLDQNLEIRNKNFKSIESVTSKNPDFKVLDYSHMEFVSNFAFPVVCQTKAIKEKYLAKLIAKEVEVRPMIAGNMQNQPFYSKYAKQKFVLNGADLIHECGFYFGNYPELTEEDLNIIKGCLSA